MNAKDIDISGVKLKCLVYGKSGTGKTTFASTFPKPYFFDFDGGMLSVRGKDVEYDTYSDLVSFENMLPKIEASAFETIVIDSVTILEEYIQSQVLRLNRRTEMTLHEWMVLVDYMQALFLKLVKIPKHVVVTAHEQVIQDEITSEVLILPLIVGKKLPAQLPLYFDEVYRAQVVRGKDGKAVYQLLTKSDVKYTAKSRLQLDTVEVPDFNIIWNKVQKGGGKDGSKVSSAT